MLVLQPRPGPLRLKKRPVVGAHGAFTYLPGRSCCPGGAATRRVQAPLSVNIQRRRLEGRSRRHGDASERIALQHPFTTAAKGARQSVVQTGENLRKVGHPKGDSDRCLLVTFDFVAKKGVCRSEIQPDSHESVIRASQAPSAPQAL